MVGGDAERPCFGPAEIDLMRRALELAEGALVARRPVSRRVLQEHRRQLAKAILRLTTAGERDPVTLSAAAVGETPAPASRLPPAHRPRRRPGRRPVASATSR